MEDDRPECVKPNTDETVDSSSGEDENSHVYSGENEEVVKTFKDLVSLSYIQRRIKIILAMDK